MIQKSIKIVCVVFAVIVLVNSKDTSQIRRKLKGVPKISFQLEEKCSKDPDCKYGKICLADTCKCPMGHGGEKCEKIEDRDCEITMKKCYDSGGSCEIRKDRTRFCNCKEKILSPYSDQCENKCSENNEKDCKYGEICINGICNCPTGRSGDKCEKIEDADCARILKNCYNSGGACEFKEDKTPFCNCKEKIFSPDSNQCEKKCSKDTECKYGEVCPDRICKCPQEYTGDKCEIMGNKDCESKLKRCYDSGGSCEIKEDKTTICDCKEKFFDPSTNQCENKCAKDYECKYGEACIGSFCKCPMGHSGDKCEKIGDKDCKGMLKQCYDSDGSCEFKEDRTTFCNCKEKTLNHDTGQCEYTCSNINDCKYGESCIGGICKCPMHHSGDKCEKIKDEDCAGILVKCYNSGGSCEFKEDKTIFCNCKENILNPYSNQCEKKCPGVECANGGTCNSNGTCTCLLKTSGFKCEIVECSLVNPNCENSGGECLFDKDKKQPFCKCPETKLFDEISSTCKEKCPVIECENSGTCGLDGTCTCFPGTSGFKCELVDCSSVSPKCDNSGGECLFDKDKKQPFCKCPETKLFDGVSSICIERCPGIECENGGTCDSDGTCTCLFGTSGLKCEIVDCDLVSPMCKNSGGTCLFDKDKKQPFCKCPETKLFDEISNACKDKVHCKNGGTVRPNLTCSCLPLTSGSTCEIVNCTTISPDCEESEGVCKYDEQNQKPYCDCPEDKYLHEKSKKCEYDHCRLKPCQNGGTCTNVQDGFLCDCTDAHSGEDCSEVIWCVKYGDELCGNEAECKYDIKMQVGYCVCEDGKEFVTTNRACVDVNPCIMKLLENECNKSHEICENDVCACKTNYKYNENKDECVENFCEKTRCPYKSKCKELGSGKVLCVCEDGYISKGNFCIKRNLCTPGLSECSQKCTSTGLCTCEKHFSLSEDNKTCNLVEKEGEELSCDLECGVGTCIMQGGKGKCVCPDISHVSVDNKCVDICTARKALPTGMCPTTKCEADDFHGFRCKCEDPYEQDDDGIRCKRKEMCRDSKAIEECSKKFARCQEVLDVKGYKCDCEIGFTKDANGVCIGLCDLKVNHDRCAVLGAVCELDEKNNVKCKCPPLLSSESQDGPCNTIAKFSYLGKLSILKNKYEIKESRASSKQLTDLIDLAKLSYDVKESLEAVYGKYNNLKILDCKDENKVLNCSIELQLKSKPLNINILTSPTKCLPLNPEFCLVKPSLILKKKENAALFQPTKPCSEVKNKLCGNSTNCTPGVGLNFQCTCREGFKAIGSYNPVTDKRTFIEKCNDIDECLKPSPCPITTNCVNNYGGYDCYCKDELVKKSPESDPKVDGCRALCDPNPCIHGTCVKVENYGFSCECNDSYFGYLCNETRSIFENPAKPDYRTTAIVGGGLGTLLAVVVIGGFIMYRRLKRNEKKRFATQCRKIALSERTQPGRRQLDSDRDNDVSERRPTRLRKLSGEYGREFSDDRMIPRIQSSTNRDSYPERRDVNSDPQTSSRSLERPSREENRGEKISGRLQFRDRDFEEN